MGDYVPESLDANGCCKFCHDDGPTKCTEQANCLNVRPGDEFNCKWENTVMPEVNKMKISAKDTEEFKKIQNQLSRFPVMFLNQFEYANFTLLEEHIELHVNPFFHETRLLLPSKPISMEINEGQIRFCHIGKNEGDISWIKMSKDVFNRLKQIDFMRD
jgi:hypothetical protein